MPDPISNQIAQQAANQASQQGANPTPQQPTEVDINAQEQFEQALNSPEGTKQDINVNQTDAAEKARPEPETTLGDAILDGLERMKSSHDARTEKIEEQLIPSGDDLTVQDAVKLQFEVMQMSMEQELTGKIADKTSQGVQTLFKNQ